MYDIKIFLESNWTFWGRIKLQKEVIYWVWKNNTELMEDLRKGLLLALKKKPITPNTSMYWL